MTTVDLITQEVIRARLDGIVREMEAAVFRTGFSTIVRESHDFSCGLLDREGRVVGQSNHPSHMGAYPYCIAGLLQFYSYDEMLEGDAFLANHPYYSGTPHANDMVVMTPIFVDGRVVAFAASMGHTPDTGGVSPGSRNATARDLFGEGLQITPVRYMRDRELVRDTASFVRANSRVPDMMIGDLSAKAGVCFAIGAQRLHDVMAAYGADVVLQTFDDLGDRTERQARQYISEWQDGRTRGGDVGRRPDEPGQADPSPRCGDQGGRQPHPRLHRHGRPGGGADQRAPRPSFTGSRSGRSWR